MKLLQGNCLIKLKELKDNSVDSIVCDPPYELGFMGKKWDNTGIAYNKEMWAECLRVLKPGGHLLAFGGTRTYHRMASAIEDAGFEVRDMIEWVYGSGFPKSYNLGKGINKYLKTGNASWNGTGDSSGGALGYSKLQHKQGYRPKDYSNKHKNKKKITEDRAKEWEGWGTALKPAHEPICMARKPLAEKTVAENCLKYGVGGINIDESRVETSKKDAEAMERCNSPKSGRFIPQENGANILRKTISKPLDTTQGRFPANLIHDNSEEVRECFPDTKSVKRFAKWNKDTEFTNTYTPTKSDYRDDNTYADSGNASRFFKSIIYQAKASKSERNKGCEDIGGNKHCTVKPVSLMSYLIRMVTPKGGIVLDPFAGSGSTLVAAKQNGFNFIGIEISEEYLNIAKKRIENTPTKLI